MTDDNTSGFERRRRQGRCRKSKIILFLGQPRWEPDWLGECLRRRWPSPNTPMAWATNRRTLSVISATTTVINAHRHRHRVHSPPLRFYPPSPSSLLLRPLHLFLSRQIRLSFSALPSNAIFPPHPRILQPSHPSPHTSPPVSLSPPPPPPRLLVA